MSKCKVYPTADPTDLQDGVDEVARMLKNCLEQRTSFVVVGAIESKDADGNTVGFAPIRVCAANTSPGALSMMTAASHYLATRTQKEILTAMGIPEEEVNLLIMGQPAMAMEFMRMMEEVEAKVVPDDGPDLADMPPANSRRC